MNHVHVSAMSAVVTFLMVLVTVGTASLVAYRYADRSRLARTYLQLI